MSNDPSQNRLQFSGEAIPYFVRFILFVLSVLIYVPAAEQFTKLLQYVTSHLRFADGTTVIYSGSASDVKQPLIGVTILVWVQLLIGMRIHDPLLRIGFTVAAAIASGYVSFQLIQAAIPRMTTSNGSRLNFIATVEEFIKWQLMFTACSAVPALLAYLLPDTGLVGGLIGLGVALLSLGLVVVVMVMYAKWLASKLAGGSRFAGFYAGPLELGARLIGFVLFSMLIVTIPWSLIWYLKWFLSKYSLPARAVAAAGGYSV